MKCERCAGVGFMPDAETCSACGGTGQTASGSAPRGEEGAFRAGDVVKHGPTGETWTLACDEERGEVQWAGWPEGFANSKDCTLIKAATDDERIEMLEMCSRSRGDHGEVGWRARTATHQLAAARAALEQT